MRSILARLRGGLILLAPAVSVAVALTALVLVRPGHDGVDVVIGVVIAVCVGLLMAGSGVLAVVEKPRISAAHLPGWRTVGRLPSQQECLVVLGLAVVAVTVLLALDHPVVALQITVVVGFLEAALVGTALQQARDPGLRREQIASALTTYGPELLVYTARANDASYQLAMWLPELAKLGRPYAIVVRHPTTLAATRGMTGVPVVCCPQSADLDAVVVPTARVALYVNGVSQNVNFVGYRQLQHIYLGHGDSDKELSVHPAHAMFDQIFVAGPAAIERYRRAGVQIPADKFCVVGRPQLAGVARATGPIDAVVAPRVLLAPTWRGYNANTTLSSLVTTPELVHQLLGRGAVVHFRPHPFSWQSVPDQPLLDRVDAILEADRARTGRAHQLSAETRSASVLACFDDSDALVSDVGSVLVDYFATGKPYAVALPAGLDPTEARGRFPSLAAAYLISAPETPHSAAGTWPVLDELLGLDPRAADRERIAHHYLGEHPGDDAPLQQALVDALNRCRPEPQASESTSLDAGQD
ncbi:MAG: CDP-glycerol glycerophosphotransferase family protein [Propionibacteriaceae bacterium]